MNLEKQTLKGGFMPREEQFEKAMTLVAPEGGNETWTLPKTKQKLREAVKHCGAKGKPLRSFVRHHLKMGGQRYLEVSKWLEGRVNALSVEQFVTIIRVLKSLDGQRPEKLRIDLPKPKKNPVLVRKTINHTICLLNSLGGLIEASEAGATDVLGGDRMQIVEAVQNLCRSLGIEVIFGTENQEKNQPLTAKDLEDLGIKTTETKRRI
ncbi:MAG: hypothetical protein A2836_01765 [Candidatus Taylorbacteria bacterium RIFCSPHIGHO2_01_FULL_45_63]|uniref:Uncharacterized protein n=1 Tax=Candidatus Taylorbacteria bacterium RIFCSPHIGHO2_02_FULL_45_35 TaxID=1802311 RepID=A0A1G2MSZ5_9BACT|nr:MAG: hypothetical protein A2836_01765 [Candidatus Taylorbacteria bacterium RIFCSPHIGHO2_01_FULL_45_63]OHA26349.1 MAG: hypothetical protein A3D56_03670 [Candidatus Taylorbacteria bacterium RIFCSPHIGHO2_02_FULL_45_35]